MHALGTVDVGKVHYWLGAAAASDSNFQISFHGKQAHAAFPQESIDPVVMAAEAVMELQTIRTRNIAPSDVAVLSVSTIHSGVRVNITPDLATLSGTIRTFDDNVDEKIERRMGEVVQSIAQGSGGSAEMKFYDRCPALINDLGLTKRSLSSLKRAAGESEITLASPVMAADDFAEFGKVVPGFFFSFGTQKPGTISGINHAKNFVADDSSIPLAMRAMTYVLVDYLQGKNAE
jgi:amidohydrolase